VAAGLIIALFITRESFFFNIANWNPVASLDPMMVAANFALLPFAVFRFNIFDVVPVARHTVSVESCLYNLADVTQEAKESVREYLLGVKTRSSPEHSLLL
jgi:uncharacterized membrane protein